MTKNKDKLFFIYYFSGAGVIGEQEKSDPFAKIFLVHQ